jgi:hypothetical protein
MMLLEFDESSIGYFQLGLWWLYKSIAKLWKNEIDKFKGGWVWWELLKYINENFHTIKKLIYLSTKTSINSTFLCSFIEPVLI